MNAFNRIFTVVSLAIFLVMGALSLTFTSFVVGLFQGLDGTIGALSNGSVPAGVAIRIVLGLAWVGLMGFLLWLELRKTNASSIQAMRTTGGSKVQVSTKSVQDRVRQKVDSMASVTDASVNIVAKKKALEAIQIYAVVSHDTDLVSKGKEIENAVRSVVQEELGLNLMTEPVVTLKAAPPPRNIFQNLPQLPQINILNRRKDEPAQIPATVPVKQTIEDAIDAEIKLAEPEPTTDLVGESVVETATHPAGTTETSKS